MLSKTLNYIIYFSLFILGQSLSMWGQYVTLPFKNLTYYQGLTMALPYAWVDWIFMTFAIDIGHTQKLVTPTQDTFLLIVVQFTLLLLINKFYLKQEIYRSDIIAFFIIIIGYICSFFHVVSKIFNIPIPEQPTTQQQSEKSEKSGGKTEEKTEQSDNGLVVEESFTAAVKK
jgi:hypothetical protein